MTEVQKSRFRRVAVHEVIWPDDSRWTLVVVVLRNGLVTECYQFKREQPLTEWLGGTVMLKETSLGLVAFHNGQRLF